MRKSPQNNSKRIYWASKHNPLIIQLSWLKEKFGDIEIIQGRSDNADMIVEDFKNKACDEMVIVAPLWVIYHVLTKGIKPLYAEMEETTDIQNADLHYRKRHYKFKGFKRISEIKIKYEPI